MFYRDVAWMPENNHKVATHSKNVSQINSVNRFYEVTKNAFQH